MTNLPKAAPAVKVKPLKWADLSDEDGVAFEVRTVVGSYGVRGEHLERNGYFVKTFASAEAAKDAAQADYEQRIRSALVDAPAPPAPAAAPVRIVLHKKRGSTYEVIGVAEGQVSTGDEVQNTFTGQMETIRPVMDGTQLTFYRSQEDGKLWWRFPDEFEDGRYKDIKPFDPATAPGHIDSMAEVRKPAAAPTVDVPAAGLKQMAEEMLRDTNAAVFAAATRARVYAQMAEALRPFALIASEGVIKAEAGHVTVTTCAEYFHRASTALAAYETEARHG
ncbi:hypothetical protein KL86PLE_100283 [uncultured Pleomorphomonas sp.]|uniref:Uncharacterized protein n=1 Tax=uncultured Pleomorphomonas sp. TaxID=442121 RepID=A0A212L295_9HYPH|nr:hypothetical protein [uncultured Pleomorphomonas sp.]SCM71607.1 hypothetical protein KL86PLE_100283 [uncultured Pleomorphomonas sp.]